MLQKLYHQVQLIQNRKDLLHTKWLHCTLCHTFSCLTVVIIDCRLDWNMGIWGRRERLCCYLIWKADNSDYTTHLSSSHLSLTCGFNILQDSDFRLSQQLVLSKYLRVIQSFWVGLGKRWNWGKQYDTQVTQLVGTKFWMTCNKVRYKVREETGFCLPRLPSEVI